MSYDVTISDEEFNYTYNLSGFFRKFEARPADWNGLRSDVVAYTISAALSDIGHHTGPSLDQYNPDNGWGSWQQATVWLTEVMVACIENPGVIVEAS